MRKIILQQNAHWSGSTYEASITRDAMASIKPLIDIEEILILLGIRRAGKSTILQQIINQLVKAHEPESILYVNFDDPFFEIVYEDPKQIYQIVELAEATTGKKVEFLFLDEIQNVDAWERFVKSTYDSKIFKKIFITGSNSNLLASQYATLLTGRHIEKHIDPLCLSEILKHKGISNLASIVQKKATVVRIIQDIMTYGSYPKIYLTKDHKIKRELLTSYYNSILYKDCIRANKIRDIKTFVQLAHYLISHIADPLSYNGLSELLKCSDTTIKEFIHILENSYMIYEVNHFAYSQKQQIKQKKKYYIVDNGVIHVVAFQFSGNKGRLFENLVFTELKKSTMGDIYYYKGQRECDFIVKKDQELIAIQVCYELNKNNFNREVEGLRDAFDKLNCTKGIIITGKEPDVSLKIQDNNLTIVPFWEYFF